MRTKLYMGVDLGTSFIKAAVYDLTGKRRAQASEPVPDERPAPGVFLQRGDALFGSVCRCIRQTTDILGKEAGNIEAIAFTGQMAGSMGVDAEWKDVTTWSCTLDSRYMPHLEKQLRRFGNDIYRLSGTGSPVMCGKLEWFRSSFPQEASRIAKYVMLNGYIIGRLSQIPVSSAAIDYSLIAWTGMADIQRGIWAEELCRSLDIPVSILPRIAKGTDTGGCLAKRHAEALGLPSGIPLILGAGDKVAGCIGSAVSRNGDKIFEASSYAALSVQVDAYRPDLTRREFDIIGNILPGRYYVHKYLQGSGITLDWFVNEFVRNGEESIGSAFRRIEEMALRVSSGCDNMLSIGLLGGSAMPFQPSQKGLFFGHTWAHGKGHFYRSLLEGFSYELAGLLQRVDDLYPEYTEGTIRLIGGGAESAIWPQMLADVTGRTFSVLSRNDVALWGAALLAAAGIGDVADINETASSSIATAAEFKPRREQTAIYRPYVEQYSRLRRELLAYYADLSAI